jgi:hypothetical protein
MRIAVLILGLVLGALMFVQTFLVYALSGVAQSAETGEAGAVGLFMALLWLLACALVIPIPLASAVVFVVAGILGFAASGDFPDLAYWGGASIILAVLSFIGWFTKRRADRRNKTKEAETERRHREMVASLSRPTVSGIACASCGETNPQNARFCSECGAALASAVATTSS